MKDIIGHLERKLMNGEITEEEYKKILDEEAKKNEFI